MSEKYNEYLTEHIDNVKKGYAWLVENLPEIANYEICADNIYNHDKSKYEADEYDAYDEYFYGNKSFRVVQDFNRAWLLHIHRNPHHWQYWILINDNPDEGKILIDMPHQYIVEMICDWWSFSWKKGDLYEIFNWYDERKEYIKLSDDTRKTVEGILNRIKMKLKQLDEKGE